MNENEYYFCGSLGKKIIGKEFKDLSFISSEDDGGVILIPEVELNVDFFREFKNKNIANIYICSNRIFLEFENADMYYSLGVPNYIKNFLYKNNNLVIGLSNKEEEIFSYIEKEVILL